MKKTKLEESKITRIISEPSDASANEDSVKLSDASAPFLSEDEDPVNFDQP